MSKTTKILLAAIPIALLSIIIIYLIVDNASQDANSTGSYQENVIENSSVDSIESTGDEPTENYDNTTNDNNTATDVTPIVNQNRCRGCGRCVQIDPAHFQSTGRTVTVKSQESLDSSSLTQAINSCPEEAISLN
jgi:ferredoxin